jgi:alpha-L-rhamnosidase
VLGIDLAAPGGSELSISIPDTGLTAAKGTRPTQHGTVASSWKRDGSGTSLTTTIPVNTTAVVELPAGDYTATGRGGVRPVKVAGGPGTVRFEVGSGTWSFVSR